MEMFHLFLFAPNRLIMNQRPPISSERRQQLYDSLGKTLAGYEKQLRFSFSHSFENDCLCFLRRISFIGADLCVAIRAELLCQEVYARRFYLKRLWINIVEAYRALYSTESDEQSYISLFTKAYPSCVDLETMSLCIEKLQGIGKRISDVVEKRNSFAHYDRDVWKTIDHLKWIDSEEFPAQLCCDLLKIFDMLLKIGRAFLPQSISELEICEPIYGMSLSNEVRVQLSHREDLLRMLDRVSCSVVKSIDNNVRAKNFMTTFGKMDVIPLINANTMIQLIRADLACALKACLLSDTQLESMSNLRMSVVSAYEGCRKLVTIYPSAKSVLSTIDSCSRNINVHYRYKSEDYIPKMYQSYYDFSGIEKFLRIKDSLNDLNWLQEQLTKDLRMLMECSIV